MQHSAVQLEKFWWYMYACDAGWKKMCMHCASNAAEKHKAQTIQMDLIKNKLTKQDVIQTFKLITKGSE